MKKIFLCFICLVNVFIIFGCNEDKLEKPTGLEIKETIVSWEAVNGATNYKILINNEVKKTVQDTSFDLSILNLEEDVKICIIAFNDKIESDKSEEISFIFEKELTTPLNIILKDSILSWDRVDGATGYKIFVDDIEKAEVKTENYDLSVLNINVSSKIYLKSFNEKKISSKSEDIFYQVINSIDKPINLKINNKIITWDKVTNALEYVVYINDQQKVIVNDCFYDISNVNSEGVLYVYIIAVNENIVSEKSDTITCVSKLEAPQDLKIISNVLTWSIVNGATDYIVIIEGKEYKTNKVGFPLKDLEISEGYITVKAILNDLESVESNRIYFDKDMKEKKEQYLSNSLKLIGYKSSSLQEKDFYSSFEYENYLEAKKMLNSFVEGCYNNKVNPDDISKMNIAETKCMSMLMDIGSTFVTGDFIRTILSFNEKEQIDTFSEAIKHYFVMKDYNEINLIFIKTCIKNMFLEYIKEIEESQLSQVSMENKYINRFYNRFKKAVNLIDSLTIEDFESIERVLTSIETILSSNKEFLKNTTNYLISINDFEKFNKEKNNFINCILNNLPSNEDWKMALNICSLYRQEFFYDEYLEIDYSSYTKIFLERLLEMNEDEIKNGIKYYQTINMKLTDLDIASYKKASLLNKLYLLNNLYSESKVENISKDESAIIIKNFDHFSKQLLDYSVFMGMITIDYDLFEISDIKELFVFMKEININDFINNWFDYANKTISFEKYCLSVSNTLKELMLNLDSKKITSIANIIITILNNDLSSNNNNIEDTKILRNKIVNLIEKMLPFINTYSDVILENNDLEKTNLEKALEAYIINEERYNKFMALINDITDIYNDVLFDIEIQEFKNVIKNIYDKTKE